MAYYIELDSATRNRFAYPNPHKYQLEPAQVLTWFPSTFATSDTLRLSVRVESVVVPYTTGLSDQPRVYLDIHSTNHDDAHKVFTVDGNHRRAKFVLSHDKTQVGNSVSWLHYKGNNMAQILRFKRGDPVAIELFTKDGAAIVSADTVDPDEDISLTKQTHILISLEPYSNNPTRVDTYG